MRLGDIGIEVKKLQNFLIAEGFLKEREFNYGIKTKLAVLEVQKFCSLERTGEWDDDYMEVYKIKKAGQRYALEAKLYKNEGGK